MSATPLWRQVFDAVERRVATSSEGVVASERFADAVTTATRATAPVARLVPTSIAPSPERAVAWVGGQVDLALRRTRNGVKVLTGFDEPELGASPATSCGSATEPACTATTAPSAATPQRCS